MTTDQPDHADASNGEVIGPEILDELVVILVTGMNLFGREVWSYVRLPLSAMLEMRDALRDGENFKANRFGEVLETGYGAPPQELVERMAREHGLIPVPPSPDEGAKSGTGVRIPAFDPPPLLEGPRIDVIPDHTQPSPFHDFHIAPPDEP